MKNLILIIITLSNCLISSLTIAQVAPTPNSPGSGNCLNFDGNDFVNIPSNPIWNFGAGNFTAECWVMFNFIGTQAVYTSWNGNAGGVGFAIIPESDGRLYFYMGCGGSSAPCSSNAAWVSSNSFQTGVWHHVAAVRIGNEMRLYNNGILVASGAIPASVQTLSSNRRIKLGRRYNDVSPWRHNGQIDEVRLWNTARTQNQIRNSMCHTLNPATEPNLVGYWQMDAMGSTCGGVTQVCDMTGNGNNGTLN